MPTENEDESGLIEGMLRLYEIAESQPDAFMQMMGIYLAANMFAGKVVPTVELETLGTFCMAADQVMSRARRPPPSSRH